MTAITASIATWFVISLLTAATEDPRAVALAEEGWRHWQAGDKRTAELRFEKAVKISPDYANAWNGLGWSQLNQGKQKEAARAFEHCVELSPEHPAARNGLGWIAFGEREYDVARKHWERVAHQAPACWGGLARVYLLAGEWDPALEWSQKALNQQPADPLLKRMVAAAEAKALDDDLRAELEPQRAAAHTQQGWALFRAGRYDDAAGAFEQAIAADPKDAAAHNGLGFCLLNMGKAVQAKPHFEAALKVWPDGAGPLNGLARCLKAEGKPEEAIAIWEKHADLERPNAATIGLAETCLELGRFAEAVRYWEAIVDKQPSDHARERLAAARAGLNEKP